MKKKTRREESLKVSNQDLSFIILCVSSYTVQRRRSILNSLRKKEKGETETLTNHLTEKRKPN